MHKIIILDYLQSFGKKRVPQMFKILEQVSVKGQSKLDGISDRDRSPSVWTVLSHSNFRAVFHVTNNITLTQDEIVLLLLKCSCFMIINFNLKFFFKRATFLLKSQHILNDPSPS